MHLAAGQSEGDGARVLQQIPYALEKSIRAHAIPQ